MIKYNDLDQDGTNNEINTSPGDPVSGNALTGWQFTVYDDTGAVVAQNTTSVENPGANGDLGIRAGLPGLDSGQEYTICETQQAGWINTDPGTIDPGFGQPCETITLTSSTTVTRYFGNYQENIAPTADAGPDQTLSDGDDSGSELVVLDGSGSSDTDGTIADSDYVWTVGPTEIAVGENPSFSFAVGTTDVTLTVTDDDGATDTDTVQITVEPPETYELRMIKYNDLDQDGTNNEINTSPGDPVSGNALTGWQFTVYDDTGAVVAQNTTSVENPGADGDRGIRASLPGLIFGQEYTICETQQAGWINTDPGTIDPGFGQPCETVTLTSSNRVIRFFGNYRENIAPTADAGPDQTLSDGDDSGSELVVLDGSGSSDTDGTIADSDYVWTVGPTEIAVGENPSFSFAVGTTDVTLTVTDDDGATDTDTVQITVEPPDTYELRMIKYNDLDQDGTNNEINTGPGDPTSGNALTGWQFTVYDDTGALVAQNTTSVENPGANGDLGIRAGLPGLISGQEYTICETQQVGWINTDPATVDPAFGQPCETVTLTSSTNATRYFGNKLVDDPPVAVCPMDQSVVDADNDGSELVDLLDNGSSDDNGIVGYRWLNGLGIQIATGEIASFSFAVGTTVVTLEVRDAADQTDSCEFEVTVTEPDLFTVGGTVTWLQGSGLRIRNNGGDELTVDENGSFSFPTPLLDGSGYNVTIASQPTGPVQTCGVVNPSGMIGGADVDDIAIACATDLAIRKSDGSATVNAGGPVTWVIEVSNNGPLPVQGALVRDLLPPAREPFASWVCVASPGAACTPSGAGSIMEFVDLEVGSSVVFALTVEIPDDFGGVLVNEASVMPPPEMDDLNPANNVAQDQSLAVLFADGFEAPLELLLRALRMNEQN